MISRSSGLEHVLVLGNGKVDSVEDGAVLVQGPGVDIDKFVISSLFLQASMAAFPTMGEA